MPVDVNVGEKPTGLHRYVLRRKNEVPLLTQRIHQMEWMITEESPVGGYVSRWEWRDVPLVVDEYTQLPETMRPTPANKIPDHVIEEITLSEAATKAWSEPGKVKPGTWCPGCSAYVGEVCHQPNCAIGPNGLQARLKRVDDGLATQLQRSMEKNCQLTVELRKLQDIIDRQADARIDEANTLKGEIEQLRSQLPEGMKHCTIQFLECAKGHGRLTATNWVPSDCQTCRIQKQQDALRWICSEARSAHRNNILKVAEEGLKP